MEFTVRSQNLVQKQTRYLGIDPGLNRTGYALIERTSRGPFLREGGVIQSTKTLSLHQRVHEIGCGLREVLAELKPEIVAIEQVFSSALNVKSSLLLAHARGAILMTIADAGIPVIHYTPAEVKRLLTGSGKAPKDQMQLAVQAALRLTKLPEPHDVADASAVALCLYHSVRFAA
ncbi:MAG: crossover junction endodeoxyribonuclease RuvC [Planctomycetota bacterium]|nr:MAG: crossover junction endodeoxyribonuclease RuvC [Planctomycetota bacterium]